MNEVKTAEEIIEEFETDFMYLVTMVNKLMNCLETFRRSSTFIDEKLSAYKFCETVEILANEIKHLERRK